MFGTTISRLSCLSKKGRRQAKQHANQHQLLFSTELPHGKFCNLMSLLGNKTVSQ
jgi:hypothetical protein